MAQNKFPTKMTRYFDSRECGGITIQGIELDTDSDGFVEAPSSFAADMTPHGFFPEGSEEYRQWMKDNPPEVLEKKKVEQARINKEAADLAARQAAPSRKQQR